MNQSSIVHYCTDCNRIYDSRKQEFLNCGAGSGSGKRSRDDEATEVPGDDQRMYKRAHVSYNFNPYMAIVFNVNYVDKDKGAAARYRQVEEILVEDNANPNFCVKWGDTEMVTTLTWAIRSNDIKLFELLLQYRADPNADISNLLNNLDENKLPSHMHRPVNYQATKGQGLPIFESIKAPDGIKFLKMLMKYNVAHFVRNETGDFPLHIAVITDATMTKMLLKYGANPHFDNVMGYDPLFRLLLHEFPAGDPRRNESYYMACVRLLLNAGVNPGVYKMFHPGITGNWSALFLANRRNFRDVTKLMLHVVCAHYGEEFPENLITYMNDFLQTYRDKIQIDRDYVRNLPGLILRRSEFGYDFQGQYVPNSVSRRIPGELAHMISYFASANLPPAPINSVCCYNIDRRIFAHQPPVQE